MRPPWLPDRESEEAELCTRSFSHFAQRAWREVEGDTPVIWEEGFHEVVAVHAQELILGFARVKLHQVAQAHAHCQLPPVPTGLLPAGRQERAKALEERARVAHLWACGHRLGVVLRSGEVEHRPQLYNKLLVNAGTGYGKSRLCSVLAPAWMWLWWPSAWQQGFSINPRSVARDAGLQLKLVRSEWWQRTFRNWWRVDASKDGETNFRNTAGGVRMAVGWNARVQGDRSHLQLVDDPEDPKKVHSEGERKSTRATWDGGISRRLHPGGTSIVLALQQRLALEDWSKHVLESGEFEHLEMPTEATAEPSPCKCPTHQRGRTLLGWRDERPPGTPLAPRLVPQKEIASRKVSPIIFEAQDQQRPKKLSGNIFPEHLWRYWRFADEEPVPELADRTIIIPPREQWERWMDEAILSGDPSFGAEAAGGTEGSRDCLGVWGKRAERRLLLAIRWEAMSFVRGRAALRELLEEVPFVGAKLIENAAHGSALVNSLAEGMESPEEAEEAARESTVEGLQAVRPEGSKVHRAIAIQHLHNAGNLYLPLHHPQRRMMVAEASAFPKQGVRNDFVDMTTQAQRYWQKKGSTLEGVEALYGLKRGAE